MKRRVSVGRRYLARLAWKLPMPFQLAGLLGPDYGLRCVLFHHIEDEASLFTRGLGVSTSLRGFETMVEFDRHRVTATVVETPFFDPERKKA